MNGERKREKEKKEKEEKEGKKEKKNRGRILDGGKILMKKERKLESRGG